MTADGVELPVDIRAPEHDDGSDQARYMDYIPLGKVRKAERNVKAHDLPGIRASIEEFGFTASLLLDERTGRIVAGHGRLEALEEMRRDNAERPFGVRESEFGDEWLVPVTRGWRSRDDKDARRYLLGDNRLSERGGWFDQQLAEELRDLTRTQADRDLISVTGFDDRDIKKLLAQLNTVPPSVPPEFPPVEPPTEYDHTCPRCQFGFNEPK